MGDFLSPKRRKDCDRLRRRLEQLTRHHNGCCQRYEYGQKAIYEQERQTALLLRQKWLDSKAKKTSKGKAKSDSSHPDHRNQIITVRELFVVVLTHVYYRLTLMVYIMKWDRPNWETDQSQLRRLRLCSDNYQLCVTKF